MKYTQMSFMENLAGNGGLLWAGLLLGMVALLLLLSYLRLHKMAKRLGQMERKMMEALDRQEDTLQDMSYDQNASITQNMREFNNSIVHTMTEISRTQQGQMDSFGIQMRQNKRMDEERMEHMQQTVNSRLEGYDTRMQHMSQLLDEKLSQNEERMERMRLSLEGGMSRMQQDNAQKLEQMRQTVDEKLHATLDRRLGESFQLVTERLEQVSKGLGEMQTLASGVGDLKKVLTNVKTRGTWGEIQLGSLLEQILSPGQFGQNICVRPGSAERVDYAVCLPGKTGVGETPIFLPIDAKFPQEDYLRLVEASERGDAAQTDAAQKALLVAVRLQAKSISEKYINPPHTTDYALLFLPVEGLYAEVLRSGALVEQLQTQYRVVITGPTTLAAILNSLQMGFRTMAIEQRSGEVWSLLGAVKTEFGRFSTLLSRTQKKLRQASDSIEDAARKTRTIQRRLHDVEGLAAHEAADLSLLPAHEEDLEGGMDDMDEDD